MRSLPPPTTSAREAFAASISRVRDPALLARLNSIQDDIARASSKYELLAKAGDLHRYPLENGIGTVSTEELVNNYEQRFAAKDSPGRNIYDSIKVSPPDSRCPLCGQRTVSSLDHHLPKRLHPALAVAPLNLIPACSDCNKLKHDRRLRSRSDQTLHPYFDDADSDVWLRATIIEVKPVAVVYRPSPPTSWPSDLTDRVLKHFEVFDLADLFAAQAATELAETLAYDRDLYESAGPVQLRAHLWQMHRSISRVHKNSWRTALYSALAASSWYVDGGAF